MKAFILLLPCLLYAQSTVVTFDTSDEWGISRIKQPVIFGAGTVKASRTNNRLLGPLGETAWQQLSDGSIAFIHPMRPASMLASLTTYGVVRANEACAPTGCVFNTAFMPSVGAPLKFVSTSPGSVPESITEGTKYCVLAQSPGGGYTAKSFSIGTSCASGTVTFANGSGTGATPSLVALLGVTRQGDGIYLAPHTVNPDTEIIDGTPVRFRAHDVVSSTLPTGLSEGTTYFLKNTGTRTYDVYSDAGLSSKITLTTDETGVMEMISYWYWTFQSGAATTATQINPVVTAIVGDNWEITNGLTGFRVPTVTANSSRNRAPIQGIKLADGTWTGSSGPNYMKLISGDTTISDATDYRVTFLERGQVMTKVRIDYTFSGSTWTSYITLYADSQNIIVDDDSTRDLYYSLRLDGEMTLDRVRWRSSANDIDQVSTFGAGAQYSTLGLAFSYKDTSGGVQSTQYALAYNNAGASTTPVIGVTVWDATDQVNSSEVAYKPTLVNLASCAEYGDSACQAIRHVMDVTTRVRHSMSIFIGTKADLPTLLGPTSVSKGALFAWQAGQWPYSKIYGDQFALPSDPGGGWPYPLLTDAIGDSLTTGMKEVDATFYTNLRGVLATNDVDVVGAQVLDAWRYTSRSSSAALAGYLALGWVTGQESYAGTSDYASVYRWRSRMEGACGTALNSSWLCSPRVGYEGGFDQMKSFVAAGAVLVDPQATSGQKTRAKRLIALVAGTLNDPNYSGMTSDGLYTIPTGESLGLQNQQLQMMSYKAVAMNHARTNSWMSSRYSVADNYLRTAVQGTALNSAGNSHNSSHYISTYTEPQKGFFNEIKAWGYTLTADETTKWGVNLQQELALVTPPDPRFAATTGKRMMAGIAGDTAVELSERLSTLVPVLDSGTAQYGAKTLMSGNLSSFYFPALFMIDDQKAEASATLTSRAMTGWGHALRSGWGTTNENYAITITSNGNDHQHGSSTGETQIWALKAPLSVSHDNLYSPTLYGALWKNNVVLESVLSGYAWADDNQPLQGAEEAFGTASEVQFFAGTYTQLSAAQYARTAGPTWARKMAMFAPNAAYPIIALFDSYSGTGSTNSKIHYYNQAASGSVTFPDASSVTPTARDYTADNNLRISTTSPFSLTQDVLNRFQFTGQDWTRNSGTINWDLYVIPGGSTPQASIGHIKLPMQVSGTRDLYGASPGSSLYTLRVKAAGSVTAIYMPFRKAETPTRTVSLESCGTQIVQGSATTCISGTSATYSDGTTDVLATFDATSKTHASMTASGGPQEVTKTATTITWKIGGLVGATRTLTLPSGWYPNKPIQTSGTTYTVYHDGTPNSEVTITFSSTPVTLTTRTLRLPSVSGATGAKVQVDSEYLGYAACDGECRITLSLAAGEHTLRWRYLDSNGAVVGDESASFPLTIN